MLYNRSPRQLRLGVQIVTDILTDPFEAISAVDFEDIHTCSYQCFLKDEVKTNSSKPNYPHESLESFHLLVRIS